MFVYVFVYVFAVSGGPGHLSGIYIGSGNLIIFLIIILKDNYLSGTYIGSGNPILKNHYIERQLQQRPRASISEV